LSRPAAGACGHGAGSRAGVGRAAAGVGRGPRSRWRPPAHGDGRPLTL